MANTNINKVVKSNVPEFLAFGGISIPLPTENDNKNN